jgi:tripartite-type tricarboxylate transporter receptor subunit TctC
MAPRSTSPAILSRLHAEFGRLLQKPEIVERLSGLGAEPAYGTPQQFSTHLQREHELWGRLIRQSGIKLE